MMDNYLKETRMLNYKAKSLEELVRSRNWKELDEFERIGAIYDYVRNEILFGYNRSDLLSAEEVLADGYGQCNTKATLLMALLVHTWVEVLYKGQWIALEGVITDEAYVRGVKKRFPLHAGEFKAYAISVPDLKSLDLNWKGENLFVQNASVVKDYGVFESPDIFFSEHKQTWNRIKDFAYVHFGRKMMNRNVAGIRISARSVERRENTYEFQYNLR